MLKRLLFIAIPSTLVLVWFLYTGANVDAFKDGKVTPVVPPPRPSPIIRNAMTPRKVPELGADTSQASEACRDSFHQMLETDVAKTIRTSGKEGGLSSALVSSKSCELPKDLSPTLTEHLRRLKEVCKNLPADEDASVSRQKWLDEAHPCLLQSLVYRSLLNAHLRKNLSLTETTDIALLTDKLIASMAEKSPRETIAILDRLEELTPGIEEIDRARASSYLSIAQEEAHREGDVSATTRQKLLEAVWLAKQYSSSRGSDDELLKIDLYSFFLVNRSARRLMDRAAALREQYPKSGVPEHFLAIASFENGDKQSAIDHLRRYEVLTGDPRAKATIARIQNGNQAPFELEFKQAIEMLQMDLEPIDAE